MAKANKPPKGAKKSSQKPAAPKAADTTKKPAADTKKPAADPKKSAAKPPAKKEEKKKDEPWWKKAIEVGKEALPDIKEKAAPVLNTIKGWF